MGVRIRSDSLQDLVLELGVKSLGDFGFRVCSLGVDGLEIYVLGNSASGRTRAGGIP